MGIDNVYQYTNLRLLSINSILNTVIKVLIEDSASVNNMSNSMVNYMNSADYSDPAFSTKLTTFQTNAGATQDIMATILTNYNTTNYIKYSAFEACISGTVLPFVASDKFATVSWKAVMDSLCVDISGSIAAGHGGWFLYSADNFAALEAFFVIQQEAMNGLLTKTTYYQSLFSKVDKTNYLSVYLAGKNLSLSTIRSSFSSVNVALEACRQSLIAGITTTTAQITAVYNAIKALSTSIATYTAVQRALFVNAATSIFGSVSSTKQRNMILANDTTSASAIYADEKPPSTDASGNGWKFTNTVAGYKINWYFLTNASDSTYKVGGLSSFYFIMNAASITSLPFFVIYSKNSAGTYWYGTKKVFTTITPTPVVGQKTLVYYNTDPTTIAAISDQVGAFDAKCALGYDSTGGATTFVSKQGHTDLPTTDVIYLAAIGTNSAAAVNNVNFSILEVGMLRSDAITTLSTVTITRSTSDSLTVRN